MYNKLLAKKKEKSKMITTPYYKFYMNLCMDSNHITKLLFIFLAQTFLYLGVSL